MDNCECYVILNKILQLQGSLSLVAAAIQYLLFFQLSEHPHNEHMSTKEAEAVFEPMVIFRVKNVWTRGLVVHWIGPFLEFYGEDLMRKFVLSIHQSGTKWEKEMATHSSILAWEIPWTEEHGGLQSSGSQKSQAQFSD